jgi:hypothetical protein
MSVPSSELASPPLPQASVSPRNQSGGGATLACRWGGGGSQFGRLERKPGTLSDLSDSLDDLEVGGEDDHEREDEAQEVQVRHKRHLRKC